MRKTIIFIFCLLSASTFVKAQTITLDPIDRLAYCVGDSMIVPYFASGTFEPDNHFTAQLSDGSGSFATFTNIGNSTSLSGTITMAMSNTGNNFRVRISSTDPYIISSNTDSNIVVVDYPNPSPTPSGGAYILMTGDSLQISDRNTEPVGSTFFWKLDSTASPANPNGSAIKVQYSSPGSKTGTLTVTNPTGCTRSATFQFNLVSCSPTIHADVHIVTGTESGTQPNVWVKAGGNFTTSNEFGFQTVFAEPGSSVIAGFRSYGVYYLKPESSFDPQNEQGWAIAILDSGNTISHNNVSNIFSCDSLQFDYSLLPDSLKPHQLAIVEEQKPASFSIAMNHLLINSEDVNLSVKILSILGTEVLSQHGVGELDVDLSPLTAGVYFAVIQSGDVREVRKIAVVH